MPALLLLLVLLPVSDRTRRIAEAAEAPGAASQSDTPGYVGSALCRACHAQAADALAQSSHAGLVGAEATESQVVGCEACHGPGSEHVGSTGRKPIGETFDGASPEQVEAVCGRCHLAEGGKVGGTAVQLNERHWGQTEHARSDVSCVNCHEVHGEGDSALRQPVQELCLGCHGQLQSKDGGYTHQPVAEGQCLLCHQPHGSGASSDLVAAIGDTCRSCHAASVPGFSEEHGGYAMDASSCVSCHNPHSFDRKNALLRGKQHQPFAARRCDLCHAQNSGKGPSLSKPQQEVCSTCHAASQVLPAADAEGNPMGHHLPVEQGLCTLCHDPHVSDHKKYMKDELSQVCFSCHRATEQATLSPYEHAPVATGNCLLCHKGHAAVEKHLLNKGSIELCESCHATQGQFSHPVGISKGKTVLDPNTGEMLVCANCHAVHGSDIAGLLPSEEMTLCRSCHSK